MTWILIAIAAFCIIIVAIGLRPVSTKSELKPPEIARIQDNISPVQFQLYFEEILDAVVDGFKLEKADNVNLVFVKGTPGVTVNKITNHASVNKVEHRHVHAPISVVQSNVFESNTFCGNCGEYDIHGMREPILPQYMPQLKQDFTDEDISDIVVVNGPGGRKYVASKSSGKMFGRSDTVIDEWNYKTIRKCNNCGHEWGQK